MKWQKCGNELQADTSMCAWQCSMLWEAPGMQRRAAQTLQEQDVCIQWSGWCLALVIQSSPKPQELPKPHTRLGFHDSWKKKHNYSLRGQHMSKTKSIPWFPAQGNGYTHDKFGESSVCSWIVSSTAPVWWLTASSNTNHQAPAYTKDFVCLISWWPNLKSVKS